MNPRHANARLSLFRHLGPIGKGINVLRVVKAWFIYFGLLWYKAYNYKSIATQYKWMCICSNVTYHALDFPFEDNDSSLRWVLHPAKKAKLKFS